MSEQQQNISTMASVIQQGIENRLKELHTCMPGFIESFDATTQLATVQPAIKRIFKTTDGDVELLTPASLPKLINVPVVFPKGGGFSLTFPIAAGDECLIMFCERSIDKWYTFGEVREPAAKRFHSLSDAVCYVGLNSKPNNLTTWSSDGVELKRNDDGATIRIGNDNSITITSTDNNVTINCVDATVTASGNIITNSKNTSINGVTQIDITAPTINLNGNTTVTGSFNTSGGTVGLSGNTTITGTVTNNGVNVGSTHVHPQGVDSNGDTQQNTGVPQ